MFFKNKTKKDETELVNEILTNDSFELLNIEVSGLDVIIKEGKKFEVSFHGSKYNVPQLNFEDDRLLIKEPDVHAQDISRWEKGFFRIEITHAPGQLLVSLPEDTNLKSVNVKSASGDISIADLKANELNIVLSSADVVVESSEVKDLTVATTSGDIRLQHIKLKKGDINLTSGDFKIENSVVSELLEVNTVSGDNTVKETKFKSYCLQTKVGENRIFGKQANHAEFLNASAAKLKLSTISGDNTVE